MNEHKPCPFCEGGSVVRYSYHFANNIYYQCCKCGCFFVFENESKDTWNTHPAEDAKDKEIERLKAEVTRYRRALHNLKDDCQKRLHWKNCSGERLFLHEVITHIDAELDYAPDTNVGKMEEK